MRLVVGAVEVDGDAFDAAAEAAALAFDDALGERRSPSQQLACVHAVLDRARVGCDARA